MEFETRYVIEMKIGGPNFNSWIAQGSEATREEAFAEIDRLRRTWGHDNVRFGFESRRPITR